MKKRVSVIGLGYMGLPTAIILAESGFNVFGYDIDEKKVELIKNGNSVISEPDLNSRLNFVLKSKFFSVSTDLQEADYYLISVPTPITSNKKADLNSIWAAVQEIAKKIKKNDTVILESTSSVGATKKLAQKLEKLTGLIPGKDFFIGYSPERAIPGKTFFEIINNNRVIGGINEISTQKIAKLYSKFVKGEISLTNSETAEMVKLVENSSRDVQIAFANQVASMAYEAGIDPYRLIEIANKHPRVNILSPRCGVGGHCIAVDPWFLVESFPEHSELLKVARQVNDLKPGQVIKMVERYAQNLNLDRKYNLLILGLTFKPDVDDLRESPALQIAKQFADNNCVNLFIADPNITKYSLEKDLQHLFVDYKDSIKSANIILLLVGHKEFRDPNLFLNNNVLDFSGMNINSTICASATTLVKSKLLERQA
jgi:UDP-N-acetyl-D-mannosaminuronic acid dehydrogenase